MVMLTEEEKIAMWESDQIKLYYRLRDVELYIDCLKKAMQKAQEETKNTNSKYESQPPISEILRRIDVKTEQLEQYTKNFNKELEKFKN